MKAVLLAILILAASCVQEQQSDEVTDVRTTPPQATTSISPSPSTHSQESREEPAIITDTDLKKQEPGLQQLIIALNTRNLILKEIIDSDLDQDDVAEKIVVLGESTKSDDPVEVFVVKQSNSGYTLVGQLDRGYAGWLNGVDIITLDTTGKPYLYASRTNGWGGSGFELYSLHNDKIVHVDGSFPPTGNGSRAIERSPKDGAYHKVVHDRFADVQHRELVTTYDWNGTAFVQSARHFNYGTSSGRYEYPSTPELVMENYLEDRQLLDYDDDRQTIAQEMKLLTDDSIALTFDLSPYSFDDLIHYEQRLDMKRLRDEAGSVILEIRTDKQRLYGIMRQKDGVWKISEFAAHSPVD